MMQSVKGVKLQKSSRHEGTGIDAPFALLCTANTVNASKDDARRCVIVRNTVKSKEYFTRTNFTAIFIVDKLIRYTAIRETTMPPKGR